MKPLQELPGRFTRSGLQVESGRFTWSMDKKRSKVQFSGESEFSILFENDTFTICRGAALKLHFDLYWKVSTISVGMSDILHS